MHHRTKLAASITFRALALTLAVSVFALGTESVSHWHGFYHDEDHCTCQVCHVGHAAIPQPAAQIYIHHSAPIESLLLAPMVPITAQSSSSPSIPRAPPA